MLERADSEIAIVEETDFTADAPTPKIRIVHSYQFLCPVEKLIASSV